MHASFPQNHPDFICFGETIFDADISFGNWHGHMLAYFEGYILVRDPASLDAASVRRLVYLSVASGKTLVFEQIDPNTAKTLRRELRCCRRGVLVLDRPSGPEVVDLLDVHATDHLVASQLTRLVLIPALALRRFTALERAQRKESLSLPLGVKREQTVRVVGVAPSDTLHSEELAERLNQAELLVSFPFVMGLLKDLEIKAPLELMRYDWQTYANNIKTIHNHLLYLLTRGHDDVTLVVEGNPEVYDLLPYLHYPGRCFNYEAILPAIVICADDLAERYHLAFDEPGYSIVSGYSARHSQSASSLTQQLLAYLDTELSCFIIELYSGDFSKILRTIQACRRPKCLLVLSDIFTDHESIYAISSRHQAYLNWLEHGKGFFTSLVVVDEERLLRSEGDYQGLLRDHDPFGCGAQTPSARGSTA